jgi:creatinine amidohydrolase
MRMMGSLTMPTDVYAVFVEWVARSLRFHGMRDIAFIWDSGGNAAGIRMAAEKLNKEWAGSGARVHLVADYYASTAAYEEWLKAQGETDEAIGQQAGITQTSEVLAIDPRLLRQHKFAMGGPREMEGSGVTGDPRRASVAYGQKSIEMKVEAAVKQIRALMAGR